MNGRIKIVFVVIISSHLLFSGLSNSEQRETEELLKIIADNLISEANFQFVNLENNESMFESNVDALNSPDWGMDFLEAAEKVGNKTILIGNISPVGKLLTGNPDEVRNEVSDLLKAMEPNINFMLSPGCDLPHETTNENIEAFIRIGREYSFEKKNCKHY